MVSPKQAHYGINLTLHIWILFTFLTIFFFTYITRKEIDTITRELNSAIDKNIPVVMDNIDSYDKKVGGKIKWGQVNNIAKKIEEKYDNKLDPEINVHNKKLIKISIIICVVLFLIVISAILYFTLYKKYDIGLGTIILENFFIAVFIGIIEALFFLNVALKYSPVTTADMVTQIINRTEYNVNEQLET
jgi:hypothetical protein